MDCHAVFSKTARNDSVEAFCVNFVNFGRNSRKNSQKMRDLKHLLGLLIVDEKSIWAGAD